MIFSGKIQRYFLGFTLNYLSGSNWLVKSNLSCLLLVVVILGINTDHYDILIVPQFKLNYSIAVRFLLHLNQSVITRFLLPKSTIFLC